MKRLGMSFRQPIVCHLVTRHGFTNVENYRRNLSWFFDSHAVHFSPELLLQFPPKVLLKDCPYPRVILNLIALLKTMF